MLREIDADLKLYNFVIMPININLSRRQWEVAEDHTLVFNCRSSSLMNQISDIGSLDQGNMYKSMLVAGDQAQQ